MMQWAEKAERERFYLLPGMGGKASRRKQRLILQWAIAAGLVVSAVVAWVLLMISAR